jgi:hypothetical protein
MQWADSATYKGKWQMGYADGKGVFTDSLGNQYNGEFRLSMAHGQGIFTNTLGAIYEGDWRHDMQHGEGQEKWLGSGSTFSGIFVNGLRQGYGVWVHEGKCYQGEWRNNMIEGLGTMEWGVTSSEK